MTGSNCRPLPVSFFCSQKANNVYLVGLMDRITDYAHVHEEREEVSHTEHNNPLGRKVTSSRVTKEITPIRLFWNAIACALVELTRFHNNGQVTNSITSHKKFDFQVIFLADCCHLLILLYCWMSMAMDQTQLTEILLTAVSAFCTHYHGIITGRVVWHYNISWFSFVLNLVLLFIHSCIALQSI